MNQSDFQSPTLTALRSLSDARQVLEEVVTSSESFDYRRAKAGLKDLQRMIRELGREEARLRAGLIHHGEIGAQVVQFPAQRGDRIDSDL